MIFRKFPVKLFFGFFIVAVSSLTAGSMLIAVDSDNAEKKKDEVVNYFGDEELSTEISKETGASSLDKISDIRIQVVSKDTKIQLGDSAQLSYEITGRLPKSGKGTILAIQDGGSVLTLESLDEKGKFNKGCNCYLTITLPKTFSGSIHLKTVSGDQTLTLSDAQNLQVTSVSGDIKVEAGHVDSLDATSVSGNIQTRLAQANATTNGATMGSIDLKTTSGDVEFFTNQLNRPLKAKTVSGDVTLNLTEKDSFAYDLNTVSGDINFLPQKMSSSKNLSGKIGDGKYRVDVKTTSGDMTLNIH
ncbi:MAG: DUF4097 domain-containing protein [Oligoflexales bacterium]